MIYHSSDWHLDHENILKFDNRPDANIDAMNARIIGVTNEHVGERDLLVYHGDFLMNKRIDRDDIKGYVARFRHFMDQLRCQNIIFVCGNHDRTYIRKHGDYRPNWPLWELFKLWQCDYCDTVYDQDFRKPRFGLPTKCLKKECEGLYDGTARHPIYNLHPMGYELRITKKLCADHGIPSVFDGQMVVCTHYSHRVWNKSHHARKDDPLGRAINLYGHSHGGLPGIKNSFDVGFNVWNRPLSLLEILEKVMPEHNTSEDGKVYFGHHNDERE